ncbi:hypothetical protein GDO78_015907 [Eleutherodactylus coqui]|uniref:Secreted protein n=1 Tax=Eleutherodactylus coqui TaxID=57060 RepID=A0A8J6B6T6_ELECQ|nr:hypothetical protein GDO78_015907 [Eleutherodactylus coqui]
MSLFMSSFLFYVFLGGYFKHPSAPFLQNKKIKVLPHDFGRKISLKGDRRRRYHEHCIWDSLHHGGSSLGCSIAVSVL